MKNIVLIGMPGSGKSTVGVLLAKALGLQFCDTDLLIQQKTGEKLQETIDTKGLSYFLTIEEKILSNLDCNGFVIATGGSAVLSSKAMEHLKRSSKVVFLDVPLEEIKQRINNITTRGIAMEKDDNIDTLFKKRLPLYRKYADITLRTEKLTLEDTVEEIIKVIYI
ncbi:MAG: shikimate kinase [Ruminococcaceae bacterium]|nr:shikimate kinase [Oscillospiraceae bacterium]